jgi:hypothetical protein
MPFTTIPSIISTLAIVSGGIFAAIQLLEKVPLVPAFESYRSWGPLGHAQ